MGVEVFTLRKDIQMSSCTYLIAIFQAVTALITVSIVTSSNCLSIK